MTNHRLAQAKGALVFAVVLLATTVSAQTRIAPRRNSFSPAQDVQLGRQAASEVRQQLPMLNDGPTEAVVERIGRRLVAAVPPRLRQPAFRYTFDVVNVREINAFALPGGPMFLNRGMLQAAKAQKFQLGAIAGQVLGSIVGGTKGAIIAQGSQIGLGTYFMKYGREYEREADLLGAQIMARAGYDPRQMANMFRTIQREGGGRGPEWLSDHPDPGNRYTAINREAASLRVNGSADTGPAFEAVHARLNHMRPAPSAAQFASR